MSDRPVRAGDIDQPPLFFVHIMRTAGTTFRMHLREQYGSSAVYPDFDRDLDPEQSVASTQNPQGHAPRMQAVLDTYISVKQLRSLPAARTREVRAYAGHFPYVASQLLGFPVTTVTLLREPVARTISYLRATKQRRARLADHTLEQIYDDGWIFPMYVHNHQAKVLSMEPGDRLESVLDVIDVDDRRLAVAMDNLDAIDVVGVMDQFDEFVAEVAARRGWFPTTVPRHNTSEGNPEVSDALRERILEDNAADVAVYERARALAQVRGEHSRGRA